MGWGHGSRNLFARRAAWVLAVGTVSFVGVSRGQDAATALTPKQIAQLAIPSVVLIKTPLGLGSGFIVSSDGKIVTNYHVIRGVTEATIETSDKVEHKDVEVIALDPKRDLAVLRIGAHDLKPLTLADSSAVQPGDHIVAIGNPLGLGDTISDGLLSGIRELPELTILQISAPISPGSSGGPVLNDHGQVIGVSTFVLNGGQNLNFAIPIDVVKSMISGDKAQPLSAVFTPLQKRHIPDYPLSLLDACPAAGLQTVVRNIQQAITVGAPLYNQGNFEACYRIYEGAALDIQTTAPQCPGPARALADGVANAQKLSGWSAKAWAMRDAFDGVLAVAAKKAGGAGPAGAIERHVPSVPASAIDECPADDVTAIAASIGSAIDSGAPLYDNGDVEACYRIYAGAIDEIDRKFDHCPAARKVLTDGLHTADQATGWPAKAWALRDSFDGLLNAIDERRSRAK